MRYKYFEVVFYHVIYDFYTFLVNYVEKIPLTKSDKRKLSEIQNNTSKVLDVTNINKISHALLILLGAIKNYKKINNWRRKRKVNIPLKFDYLGRDVLIKEIMNRLRNGTGFEDTLFLPKDTPSLFFGNSKFTRPNDDNLFFTLNVFHFHLPVHTTNKRTDDLLYVQITNNCANCMYIGNHKDLYNYKKHFDMLTQLKSEFNHDVQLPIGYDDLLNRRKFQHIADKRVTYAPQYLHESSSRIFNVVFDPKLIIKTEDIKEPRQLGINIFTKDYYTTYTKNGINVYYIYALSGMLKGLYYKLQSTADLCNLSPEGLNIEFEYMLNEFINFEPITKL